MAGARLPTLWGNFLTVGFEEPATGQDHIALAYGDISGQLPVLAHAHSECLAGDALLSLRCDCDSQLEAILPYIVEGGWGIPLHHRQEGHDIGLLNKICAYALQDQGYDTAEVDHQLGFAAGERGLTPCADMSRLPNVERVRSSTNSLKKVEIPTEAGVNIVERVPLIVGRNSKNVHYPGTKVTKMSHLLNNKLAE